MPGRPKTGPPYPEVPEVYVVVTNPWGMNPTPRERHQNDFNRVGAWVQFVLREAGVGGGRTTPIECIYGMGTRDEIIIQFPEGTDIIPFLGEHRWADIASTWTGRPDDSRSTCAFIYNWRNHGDPASHNWSENFPDTRNVTVPAKSPYPSPSWVQPPRTLKNFVHSIPRPLDPTPVVINQAQDQLPSSSKPPPPKTTPSPVVTKDPTEDKQQEEQDEDSAVQNPESASLFRPYEPPSQHPSHAQFLNPGRAHEDNAPAPVHPPESPIQPPALKFVKKLDPYELEEDALRALKSEDEPLQPIKVDPDIKPIPPEEFKVKMEAIDTPLPAPSGSSSQHTRDARRRAAGTITQSYQPSTKLAELVNAYLFRSSHNMVSQTDSRTTPSTVRPPSQPPARQVYQPPHQPSKEVTEVVNAYLATIGVTPAGLNVSPADARPTRVSVKREYEEVGLEFSGKGKRIKIEES